MIPKIIHFVWVDPFDENGIPEHSDIPAWAHRNIDEFARLNPYHEIRIHGEESLLDKYRPFYDQCIFPCQQADLIRLSALETCGGWYFDIDYWPLRPIANIESAFMLDGGKMFVTDSGRKSNLTNGIIGVSPDWGLWDEILPIMNDQKPTERNAFGPKIINTLAEKFPDGIHTGTAPFFNGLEVNIAPQIYRKCINGSKHILLNWIPGTCGQLPFAIHLWAGSNASRLERYSDKNRPLAVIYGPDNDERYPWPGVGKALPEAGYDVEFDPTGSCAYIDFPSLAFIWNGLKGKTADEVEYARRATAQIIYLEHGFFDRQHYCQADKAGFLHRASWADKVHLPAPDCGKSRLARFYPDGIKPLRRKNGGYILVLGQMSGDTQMYDSEIQGPVPLESAVKRALPAGVKCYFRPHPGISNVKPHPRHDSLPRFDDEFNERPDYKRKKHGSGLVGALSDAIFVITINSNAIVESLAEGVPVLAFGPSTALNAGAAHKTSLATIGGDIKDMLRGWMPERAAVTNYLEWLAARQWNREEFANPELIKALINGESLIETPGHIAGKSLAQEAAD